MRHQLRIPAVVALGVSALALSLPAVVSVPAYALSPSAEEATRNLFNPGIISDVAERVSPAVVSITTKSRPDRNERNTRNQVPQDWQDFFGFGGPGGRPQPRGPEMGIASGVIISDDGFIVTNNHVVDHTGDIRVRLSDGRDLPAKVIGADPSADLALIKVEAKGLPYLKFGDSSKLRLGEFVLALGNPFGVGQTVTMGIVSAKGRSNMGIVDYEDFIQTDAAINPGNSGGALVSLDGSLMGINTAILSRSGGAAGIGFAVPANMARPIIEQIRKTGKVSRGWLGVGIQDLTPELAKGLGTKESRGVVISDVLAEGPAAKAGLQTGDVVVSVDGRPVTSSSELRNAVAMMRPGSTTKMVVRRGDGTKELAVKLDEKKDKEGKESMEESVGESGSSAWQGVELEPLTPQLRTRLELPREIEGVVVADLDPSSRAAEAGLRPGDVIVAADKKPVKSIGDLKALAKKKGELLLRVWRQGSFLFLVMGGE